MIARNKIQCRNEGRRTAKSPGPWRSGSHTTERACKKGTFANFSGPGKLNMVERLSSMLESFRTFSLSLAIPSGSDDRVSGQQGPPLTSYFSDSSGRSKLWLSLKLDCLSSEELNRFVRSGCVRPAPSNSGPGDSKDKQGNEDKSDSPQSDHLMIFEAKCVSNSDSNPVSVEGVAVLSSFVEGTAIIFETEIVVRAGSAPSEPLPWKAGDLREQRTSSVSADMEVTVALLRPSHENRSPTDAPELLKLDLRLGNPSTGLDTGNVQARLTPVVVNTSLKQALELSVKSVPGSSYGSTLVSITMKHPNTHQETVTVTSIVMHPGHSRQEVGHFVDRSMPGGTDVVTDMSRFVQWGYVPRTEPHLPLAVRPRESFSTVLTIDAGEDLRCRTFTTPISVTATVGSSESEHGEHKRRLPSVVVAADAQWTTGRVAVEPADALRVDMGLEQNACAVGAPFVVSVRVLNLSTETKNLMLIMAKDDEKSTLKKRGTVNTAVVSEVNGYTFGVWGLSGDDDGTARNVRDHELLAVDAALLLGEIKSQHSVEAELRFVPLREGTLDVPNLKLYDKIEGKWYNCSHKLRIVVGSRTN